MNARNPESGRRGDPLGMMYVLAALALLLGSIVVVILMFIPSDWRDSFRDTDAYVPGSGPGFEPIAPVAALLEPAGITQLEPGRFRVVIEAYNWEFRPNEIRLPIGAEVTFRARSAQDYHGLAIAGTEILLPLVQNSIAEATHTFTEPGEYNILCADYCGSGHANMTGKVIVE